MLWVTKLRRMYAANPSVAIKITPASAELLPDCSEDSIGFASAFLLGKAE